MEKLLFYTKMNFGLSENGGIKNKVQAQAKAFRELGIETDVFSFENNKVYIENSSKELLKTCHSKLSFLSFVYSGFLKKIDINSYNYLFIRHFQINPLFLILLFFTKIRNPSIKIYMEIPTYPYKFEFEKVSFPKKIERFIDSFSTLFLRFFVDKIVTFSSAQKIFGIETIKTDNGIDIEKFGMVNRPYFNEKDIHLLGLANVQIWHGLDRLLHSIKEYYKKNTAYNVKFHIVGKGAELANLQKIVNDLEIQNNVIFHGYLSGNELLEMFQKTHLGIGSLGMHRINVAEGETSALKSREYASRGIPFVIAYRDRGFPENYPYLLQLPANETAIDLNHLINFYLKYKDYDELSQTLHTYAKDNLTWVAKLKPVVESLRNEK